MIRRITVAALVAFSACATPAGAGDNADRDLIGFSPDGRYFAFEEYGVQDGSGFPYASIYVIDVPADSWVDSPVRVRIDDDQVGLDQVRQQARSQAAPVLAKTGVGSPGTAVVYNPLSETSADPHAVSFYPSPYFFTGQPDYSLSVDEFELPAPNCPDIGQGPHRGFRLVLTTPGGTVHNLVEDTQIPQSRGCALNYGISEVLTHPMADGRTAYAILVNVFSLGFEGPDRRFIAVTGILPD